MIKIAIVDDNNDDLQLIEQYINEYKKCTKECSYSVHTYNNPNFFLSDIENGEYYDLVFLDCIMPTINGMELARDIRRLSIESLIVFITSSKDFAVDSYQIKAFNYLVKPITLESFLKTFIEAVNVIEELHQNSIIIASASGAIRIPFRDILFVELMGKKIGYHLYNSIITTKSIRNSFNNEIAPLLVDKRFVPAGSSYCVNISKLKNVDKQICTFNNNEEITIPRKFMKVVKNEFIQYWLGREEE